MKLGNYKLKITYREKWTPFFPTSVFPVIFININENQMHENQREEESIVKSFFFFNLFFYDLFSLKTKELWNFPRPLPFHFQVP